MANFSNSPGVKWFSTSSVKWVGSNEYTTVATVISSTVDADQYYFLTRPAITNALVSSTKDADVLLDDNTIRPILSSPLVTDAAALAHYSVIAHPVDHLISSQTKDAGAIVIGLEDLTYYESPIPPDIFICAGTHGSMEHMDPSNDTTTSVQNTVSIRTGGFGIGYTDYSWLIGGYEDNTGVERLDNTNYTQSTSPRADLPSMQAGGSSLNGNDLAYLVGDAWSAKVHSIDTVTETFTQLADLSLRVKEAHGACDLDFGWIIGGVRPNGALSEHVQKLDRTTETWIFLPSTYVLDGSAKHGSLYKNKTIWYGGGVGNNGLRSLIYKINLTFDFATASPRSHLTTPRTYPGSVNNAQKGWWFGGYNLGYSPVIDNISLDNDTVEARVSCQLINARKDPLIVGVLDNIIVQLNNTVVKSISLGHMEDGSSLGAVVPYSIGSGFIPLASKLYIGGGQNYDSIYGDVYVLDLSIDTSTTLVNTSLTPRYTLFAVSNPDYSWFIGGFDNSQIEVDITEKLDHASDTVSVAITAAAPTIVSNGGDFSSDSHGYIKTAAKFYRLDMSNDVWDIQINSGLELSNSGSGTVNQGLFGGGRVDTDRTDKIDVFELDTSIWTISKYQLTSQRYGVASTSVTETSWFFGGTERAQVNFIETVNHLSSTSFNNNRGSLSSAKSRSGAFSNSDYSWILGGYRLSALDELDRLDPYSDTISLIARGPLSTPKHSMGIGSPRAIGLRTGSVLRVKVPTLDGTSVGCTIPSVLFSGDVGCYTVEPYGTYTGDMAISAPRIPITNVGNIGCISIGAENHSSSRQVRLGVSTYTSMRGTTSATNPFVNRSCTTNSYYEEIAPAYRQHDANWVGGGLNIPKYEKIEASTWTTSIRGATYLPRMGGAAATSDEQAWVGGGNTVQNVVELFVYATDLLTTGDRTNLTVARSYLAATNDSNHCWYWGGLDAFGVVGVLDKLDKSNDTASAVLCKDDWPRCRFNAEFLQNRAYSLGGQVGVAGKDWVRYFEPSTDNFVQQVIDLPIRIYDYSTAVHLDHLCVFHQDAVYNFSPIVDTFEVVLSVDGFTQADAHVLGDKILLTGGTPWDASTGTGSSTTRVAKYDPTNNTYEVADSTLSYRRYNHWTCGYTSTSNIASVNRLALIQAKKLISSDISAQMPACSASNEVGISIKTGQRFENDVKSLVATPSGCFYTDIFDQYYNISTDNTLWKFSPNCDIPVQLDTLPSPSARLSCLTTGQKSWLYGGTTRKITTLNYADDTLSVITPYTDDICQSSSVINSDSYGFVLGGTRYTEAFNMSLVITDLIRKFDFSNDSTVNLSNRTSHKITRAASSRYSETYGYLLGGSITEVHTVTNEIEKVDMNTGVCSILPASLLILTDLDQAVVDINFDIICSSGHKLDTSTETVSGFTGWPTLYGEGMATHSSSAKLIGGYSDRTEDPNIRGLVSSGGISNHWPYVYDHTVGSLVACDSAIIPMFFNQPTISPYNYCSPIMGSKSTRYGYVEAIGAYATWIRTMAAIPYLYGDAACLIHEVYDTSSEDRGCIYTAFDQSVLSGVSLGKDTLYTSRNAICHLSVEHYDEDRGCFVSAIDSQAYTMGINMVWDQLESTVNTVAMLPNFYTGYSKISCSLLIGGSITTRRCYIPPAYKTNWDLFMHEGTIDLLTDKELGTGDFVEVLNKLVKSDGGTINWDLINQDIEDQFGTKDFIYSIDDSRGVVADEGVLIKPGSNMQIINLLVRLSGTDMWVTNKEGERFFLTCSKEYDIQKVGNVPITGNIMVIKLKLIEPLSANELSFEFKSARSSCYLKLMAI